MDPSYYFQRSQNPNFIQKLPGMNQQQGQNLKPGYNYVDNDNYNYGQNMKSFGSENGCI